MFWIIQSFIFEIIQLISRMSEGGLRIPKRNKNEENVYKMLTYEPVTPNEIAKKLGISHKTAQRILMQLALIRDDIKYKNSGRIHLFWRAKK